MRLRITRLTAGSEDEQPSLQSSSHGPGAPKPPQGAVVQPDEDLGEVDQESEPSYGMCVIITWPSA